MDNPDRIAVERVYDGRFLTVDRETFANPAGLELSLEIIRHPGASAVVPMLTDPRDDDPEILILRQYRYAAGGSIWEIPAGVLDEGESPEACAHRELREETGAVAANLQHLTTIYTTPGFTDEQIHLFLATDVTVAEPDHQFDEFIEVHRRTLSTLLQMIRDGEIIDGKTIVALLHLATFRPV